MDQGLDGKSRIGLINDMQLGWVVFSGEVDWPWLKLLRPGFRHCFLVLSDGRCWMTVDPMLNHMEVAVHHDLPLTFDLPRWLQSRGHAILPVQLNRSKTKPAPLAFFSCVETVKRLLGLHHRFIFTPWQLYRYLKRHR